MPFDYKKEYPEWYLPPKTPGLVRIPSLHFLAVRGQGDPNRKDGAYQKALEMLYTVAFTLKMSPRAGHHLDGYFDYVVPPLEGLWWQEGRPEVDFSRKEDFHWISLIRLPEFVDRNAFDWAIQEAARKKQRDFSPVEFLAWEERLCVQCLHLGPYDGEASTLADMEEYALSLGYQTDFGPERFHHEIYLSDARRCRPERLKTVLRHPVRRCGP